MRPRGGREETRKCGCIQLELSEKVLLSAQLRLDLFSITIKKKKRCRPNGIDLAAAARKRRLCSEVCVPEPWGQSECVDSVHVY